MRAVAAFGQPLDQAVPDLAACAGNEDDWFSHAGNYTGHDHAHPACLLAASCCLVAVAAIPSASMRLRRGCSPATRCASTTSTPAGPASAETFVARSRRQRRRRGPAAGRSCVDATNLGTVPVRSARRRTRARCSIRAASRRFTASGRRPASRRTSIGPSTSRCGSRGREQPVTVTLQKRQAGQHASRRCGRQRSIRHRASSTAAPLRQQRARYGRCSRTARRPRRSTCW